eukprot:scaffold140741_cov62-Attheya_sp.AAC.1
MESAASNCKVNLKISVAQRKYLPYGTGRSYRTDDDENWVERIYLLLRVERMNSKKVTSYVNRYIPILRMQPGIDGGGGHSTSSLR